MATQDVIPNFALAAGIDQHLYGIIKSFLLKELAKGYHGHRPGRRLQGHHGIKMFQTFAELIESRFGSEIRTSSPHTRATLIRQLLKKVHSNWKSRMAVVAKKEAAAKPSSTVKVLRLKKDEPRFKPLDRFCIITTLPGSDYSSAVILYQIIGIEIYGDRVAVSASAFELFKEMIRQDLGLAKGYFAFEFTQTSSVMKVSLARHLEALVESEYSRGVNTLHLIAKGIVIIDMTEEGKGIDDKGAGSGSDCGDFDINGDSSKEAKWSEAEVWEKNPIDTWMDRDPRKGKRELGIS